MSDEPDDTVNPAGTGKFVQVGVPGMLMPFLGLWMQERGITLDTADDDGSVWVAKPSSAVLIGPLHRSRVAMRGQMFTLGLSLAALPVGAWMRYDALAGGVVVVCLYSALTIHHEWKQRRALLELQRQLRGRNL